MTMVAILHPSSQGFASEILSLGHSHSVPETCKTFASPFYSLAPVLEFPLMSPRGPRLGRLSDVGNNT